MNWLDIMIMVTLAWFTLTSLTTGLIREALSLAGLIIGILLAGRYYTQVAQQLHFISNQDAASVVSFVAIFIVVAIASHLVASILQQVASLLFLGWADHLGGAVFGFAKGAIICEVVLILFARFPIFGLGSALNESRLASSFLSFIPILLSLLPSEFGAVGKYLPNR